MRFLLLLLTIIALCIPTTLSLQQLPIIDRRNVLVGAASAAVMVAFPNSPALAFEGGVGGLGKTKPATGVVLREGSAPIQNKQGIVSAEIVSSKGNPILVEFTSPYPLLPTTSGLEARDLQQSESAFVQVINGVKSGTSGKALYAILIDDIFGSKGKYGAYGSPVDVKISPAVSSNKDSETNMILLKATFTTFTPGLRESPRKILLNCKWCDGDTLVILIVGTTLLRFKTQDTVLTKVAESFVAIDAPKTGLGGSGGAK